MIEAYKKFWQGAFSFKGRTDRREFWSAIFVHLILLAVFLNFYRFFATLNTGFFPLFWQAIATFFIYVFLIYLAMSILPFWAMTVRRLNDADFPWALIFLNLAFPLGPLVLLGLNLASSSEKNTANSTFSTAPLFSKKIEERGKLPFSQALAHYFQGYFSFKGRSTRRNFWFLQLCWWSLFAVLNLLIFTAQYFDHLFFGQAFIGTGLMKLLLILFVLGTLFPQFALITRRLRDAGFSDIGSMILLVTSTSLTLFQKILSRTLTQSYAGSHYELLEYLLFLFLGVVFVALIIACSTKTDDLLTKQESILFNKMD